MTITETEADIRCNDLVRIFTADGVEVQALQGLNLDRRAPGRVVALVGASGSGKSTLLTILSGLDTPTAGSAPRRRARPADDGPPGARRVTAGAASASSGSRRPATCCPTSPRARTSSCAMAIGRSPRRERARRVAELLELLGRRRRAPTGCRRELSGGQQQRVAIAVAHRQRATRAPRRRADRRARRAASADVLEAMRGSTASTASTVLIVTHDPTVSSTCSAPSRSATAALAPRCCGVRSVDEHGEEHSIAEEFAVLDRVGRLQLPDDFTSRLGMRDRVRLALETDHVGVWPRRPPSDRATEEPSHDRRCCRARGPDPHLPHAAGEVHALRRTSRSTLRAGRAARRARAVRLGQDHAAQPAGRAGPARPSGTVLDRRRRADRARRGRARRAAPARRSASCSSRSACSPSSPRRRTSRCPCASAGRPPPSATRGSPSCWSWSASPSTPPSGPTSSPAASSSASASRGRSPRPPQVLLADEPTGQLDSRTAGVGHGPDRRRGRTGRASPPSSPRTTRSSSSAPTRC